MILHENENCPVCDKLFTENDDIVICPYCGTPHHRECYNSLGHCVNKDKHNTDFEYKSETAVKSSDSDDSSSNTFYYNPVTAADDTKTTCSQCGAEINRNVPFCNHCGAKQTNAQYGDFNPAQNFGFSAEGKKYESEKDTIDGKSVADVAHVVSVNTDRFINKFKANKALSWNWSGFFFGPLYLMFRKMYAQGALFLALDFAAPLMVGAVFYDKFKAVISFVNSSVSGQTRNEMIQSLNEIFANPDSELFVQMMDLYKEIVPAMTMIYLALFAVNVVIALLADKLYRKKVLSVIDKVDSNLSSDSLSVNVIPMMENEKMSQQDLRNLYLSKMGGVSWLMPMLILMVIMFSLL